MKGKKELLTVILAEIAVAAGTVIVYALLKKLGLWV